MGHIFFTPYESDRVYMHRAQTKYGNALNMLQTLVVGGGFLILHFGS